MSTVTLSKPHCAITSAVKPDGIASHAFTTALPDAQICLTLLFATLSFLPLLPVSSPVNARSHRVRPMAGPMTGSATKQSRVSRAVLDCFASLAMTKPSLCRGPLDACFADAHFARGVHYRRPGIVRQGDAVSGALGAGFPLGIAGDQDLIDARDRLGLADEIGIARDLAIEDMGGVDHLRVDVEGEHAVGKAAVGGGGAGPGQRAAEQLADECEPRALVLAKGADRAGSLGVVARPVRRVGAIEHLRVLA